MTDNEIKKALECCANYGLFKCNKCPMRNGSKTCMYDLSKLALDLINRQKGMIDGLIAGQETLQKALAEKNAEIDRLKAERNQYIEDQPYVWANVARELAERIKLKFWHKSRCYLAKDIIEIVDNVLVEMVGDAK